MQTSNLNEQLGQVDYVFSDKTGTLTQNLMEFKKMAIGKYSYGKGNVTAAECELKEVTNFNFFDEDFNSHFNNPKHENYEFIRRFMTHLAICHTVVSEFKNGKNFYNASSPDELALVNAAKYFGYDFIGRDDDNNIAVKINGKTETFTLLNVIEFSSDR